MTVEAVDFEALQKRFVAAQLAGNRRAASAIVIDEALGRGASVADVHERILQAAQREIGQLWLENVVSVAQEHMATAIANLVLSQIFERATPLSRNGKRVVVACVEGEAHELPARLVADALELAGFEVRYLGASVPSRSLLMLLAQDVPDLVALSVTLGFNAPSLRALVPQIRAAHPKLPIAVGGSAVDDVLAKAVGADLTATSAAGLVLAARRLVGALDA